MLPNALSATQYSMHIISLRYCSSFDDHFPSFTWVDTTLGTLCIICIDSSQWINKNVKNNFVTECALLFGRLVTPQYVAYSSAYNVVLSRASYSIIWFCLILSVTNILSQNISAVKKRQVQVTERIQDVISPWSQEEKLYQLVCIYKTPAYKLNSFK